MDSITVGNDISFRIGFSGHSGHLRLEPLSPFESSNPSTSVPDFIIPPAFPPETPESLKKYLEEKYLSIELDEDEFSVEKSGRMWDFDWFNEAKVHLEPSAPRLVVAPVWEMPSRRSKNCFCSGAWDPRSAEVRFSERLKGAEDSGALSRAPGPAKDFVSGSMNSRPFRPGGLDVSESAVKVLPEGAQNGDWVQELMEGTNVQTIPPGFKNGLDLGPLKAYPNQWKLTGGEQKVASEVMSDETLDRLSVQFDDLFKKVWDEETNQGLENIELKEPEEVEKMDNDETTVIMPVEPLPVDVILSTEAEVSNINPDLGSYGNLQDKKVWDVTRRNQEIAKNFNILVPDMALEFPFELDTFQKEAIYHLEQGSSVFVAAHTSAGKTVVAEYAFALATKHCTRAVYTAPIKTISNQKYRDFCGKFDVGLLTGDISLRPEANCLIMTTEILRSMLYKGADIIRDIEWVIFDEVHYVNDVERGVVWEEIIIMLPRHINIVLLSATVPNSIEFADWIERTKQKKIEVTGTLKRPVPLEHYLFYSGELYKVCENDAFVPQGLKAAKDVYKKKNSRKHGDGTGANMGSVQLHGATQNKYQSSIKRKDQKPLESRATGNSAGTSGPVQNNFGSRKEASVWLMLLNKLSKNSLLPVVIFCFSKNRCDKSADSLTGTDLTSNSEKSEIRIFCEKAFSRLKGSDRNLPQVVRVQYLLRRGIGVHHAGLLPIVKEVVEMLFCRGVIKVLFSTETFAMGVNAPARTVVFDSLRKFDGKDFRQLLPGEYIQMAGRAGRRGLDNIGTVIVMCRDEIPEESDLKHAMVGKPTKLESQFRLTYIMILHLLRVEELKVEDMLKRSFAEFHAQMNLPVIEKRLLLLKLVEPTKSIECIKGEPAIDEYLDMALKAEECREQVAEAFMQSHVAQQFLSPGKVVVVRSELVEDPLLGVILKTPSANSKHYIVLVLMNEMVTPQIIPFAIKKQAKGEDSGYFVVPKGKRGMDEEYYISSSKARKGSGSVNLVLPYNGTAAGLNYCVKEIEFKEILGICNSKLKLDIFGLLEEPSNAVFSRTVQELLKQKQEGNRFPPVLDPVKDLKLKDMTVVENYRENAGILQAMTENKCHGCVKMREHIAVAKEKRNYKKEVDNLKFQMSDEALEKMPDFQGRIDVLKETNCIDSELAVQIKGRVACEMNSGEELICTECLFENQLEDLEPEEAVALMSALVFQQRNTSEPSLTPKLDRASKRLYDTAIQLGELQARCKLPVDPEEYARENLKFGLVEVVYEWAKGTPFSEICELTDVPEGLIVRTIVRLDETCREFRNAASIMGNSALYKKMEAASTAIKRDIVFAASLYVTGIS